MPQPDQVPRISLPQLEFYALVPNHNVTIAGRRTQAFNGTSQSVPANGLSSANVVLTMNPDFGTSQAVFLHRAALIALPGDTLSELQILSTRFTLGDNTNQITDVGFPFITYQTPQSPVLAVLATEQFISFHDMQQAAGAFVPPLKIYGNIAVKNLDTTNPHSIAAGIQVTWSTLLGLVE